VEKVLWNESIFELAILGGKLGVSNVCHSKDNRFSNYVKECIGNVKTFCVAV
jgi:hypothetical protein